MDEDRSRVLCDRPYEPDDLSWRGLFVPIGWRISRDDEDLIAWRSRLPRRVSLRSRNRALCRRDLDDLYGSPGKFSF